MLKIIKKNKGQNTAEYAILIALVIGAIIAMQTYAQRGLQARMRGTSLYMKDQMGQALQDARTKDTPIAGVVGVTSTGNLGRAAQYEPYYQNSLYRSDVDSKETSTAAGSEIGSALESVKTRAHSTDNTYGIETTAYNGQVGAATQDSF